MGGGAWPFLVGGAFCLVNFINERDLSLLTSYVEASLHGIPSKRESSTRVDYACDNPPFGIKWSSKGKSESGAKLLGRLRIWSNVEF
ncbi:hypothetical protein YC2023_071948 [Brassica napus]